MSDKFKVPESYSRRTFLKEITGLGVSSVAWTFLLGHTKAEAVAGYNPRQDVFYMNKALEREHNVIMSYDYCVETGLFERVGLAMISMIQNDHLNHRDFLRKAIIRLGGTPVESVTKKAFYDSFQMEAVQNGIDALRVAKRFESQCYSIYAEIATYLVDPQLASTAGKFSAEELIHKAQLIQGIASVPYDPSMRIRD